MSLETGQSVKHRWSYGDRKHAVDALFSPEDADMYQIKFGLSSGYLRSTIRPQYYSHHAIAKRMGLIWDGVKVIVDHINRNKFDNRRENLRVVNRSENAIHKTTLRVIITAIPMKEVINGLLVLNAKERRK